MSVVHLVRASNGIGPYKTFIESLKGSSPGVDYELILAMKGFKDALEAEPFMDLVHDLKPKTVFVPDIGFDLDVYFEVATRLQRDRYCFLNSFSRILTPNWLENLEKAIQMPGVGVVGATGSWGSTRSYQLYRLGASTPYKGVFYDRRNVWEQFRSIDSERTGIPPPGMLRRRLRIALTCRELVRQVAYFKTFPAVHLRTNAFLISGDILAKLRFGTVRTKVDVCRIESGKKSMTNQIHDLGLKTLVVDRFGNTYEPENWPQSQTFWQGSQRGLMVADNQTSNYQDGNLERRSVLSRFAWGPIANPEDSKFIS